MESLEQESSKQNRQMLEQSLRLYQVERLPASVFDIYEKAKTPHESMTPLSASIAGPPVGVENVKSLLQRMERFTQDSIKEGKEEHGDIEDATSALGVFHTVSEETKVEKPDAQKVDKKIAGFIQDRIEKFFTELDKRAEAAGVELNEQEQKDLKVPLETMNKFNEGMDAYFGYYRTTPDKERQKLYGFWKEYPAVFLANILRSIDAKKGLINAKNSRALDPMVPLGAVVKETDKE